MYNVSYLPCTLKPGWKHEQPSSTARMMRNMRSRKRLAPSIPATAAAILTPITKEVGKEDGRNTIGRATRYHQWLWPRTFKRLRHDERHDERPQSFPWTHAACGTATSSRVFVMRILFSVIDLFSAVMRTRRASTIRVPCLAIVFALTVPAALPKRCGVQYFEFSYV